MLGLKTDPLLAAAQHQEGLDAVVLQAGVPLPSEAGLHLVVPVQVLQRGFGDVDATEREHRDVREIQ